MGKVSEDFDSLSSSSTGAQARKRRMERRAKNSKSPYNAGGGGDEDDEDYDVLLSTKNQNKKMRLLEDNISSSDSEGSSVTSVADVPKMKTGKKGGVLSKDALAKIPGVKKQARYVPAVPMSKEELTLWRKEARRVRNRESAAASRQKTQKRIVELEEEVGCITKKYEAALRRIVELEAVVAASDNNTVWKPSKITVPQHHHHHQTQEEEEEGGHRRATHTVSPPLSPCDSFSFHQAEDSESDFPKLLPKKSNAIAASSMFCSPQDTATSTTTATNYKISRHNACVKIKP